MTPQQEIAFRTTYDSWKNRVVQDWQTAGNDFAQLLRDNPKLTTDSAETIQNIEGILAGDRDYWQKNSGIRDDTDAMQFVITNALMRSIGMGVISSRPRRFSEDIVDIVAGLISENINFFPMTAQERRMKLFMEGYGYVVYSLSDRTIGTTALCD